MCKRGLGVELWPILMVFNDAIRLVPLNEELFEGMYFLLVLQLGKNHVV